MRRAATAAELFISSTYHRTNCLLGEFVSRPGMVVRLRCYTFVANCLFRVIAYVYVR